MDPVPRLAVADHAANVFCLVALRGSSRWFLRFNELSKLFLAKYPSLGSLQKQPPMVL